MRERERERERVNTWPKQKTGTRGWPISMAKRTNPLLVLRKAIYKGGMTVNPQFNHKKREEMVPLHSYLCMCVHERERERQGGWGCLWSKFNATKLRWLFNQESAQYCLFDFFPTNDVGISPRQRALWTHPWGVNHGYTEHSIFRKKKWMSTCKYWLDINTELKEELKRIKPQNHAP